MRVNQIVVIGTSGGGVDALRAIVAALPPDFPAAICVVMHTSPDSPGILGDLLDRCGPLRTVTAHATERFNEGTVYVAPPDFHMLVEPGGLRLTKGPKENRFRPAVDPLFRSAAQVYGPAAIGVILSGNLDDGTAGLWAIKQLGGVTIVQDPDEAVCAGMPESAIRHVEVDYTARLDDIAPLLARLVSQPIAERQQSAPLHVELEVRIAGEEDPVDTGFEHVAQPSRFACPECHGVLLQLEEGGRVRFRCHTGHAYSIDTLVASISEGIEASMWMAIRSIEEARLLLDRMEDHLGAAPHDGNGRRIVALAEKARRQIQTLRGFVMEHEPLTATKG